MAIKTFLEQFNFITNAPQFIDADAMADMIAARRFGMFFDRDTLVVNRKYKYKWNSTLGEYQFIKAGDLR